MAIRRSVRSQIGAVVRTTSGISAASLVNGPALPDRGFGALLYGGGSIDSTTCSRTTGIVGPILGDPAFHISEPEPGAFIGGIFLPPRCGTLPRSASSCPRAAPLFLLCTKPVSLLFCHSPLLSFQLQTRSWILPVVFIACDSYLLILRPVLIWTWENSTSTGRV
jgi:hypothetical protein